MGSSILNYLKIIFNNSISPKYYINVFLTFIIIVLLSPFQLIDKLVFLFTVTKKNEDPVFIIGHWRSGTTFLHNLLCQDKSYGYFNTYNSLFINNIYSSFLFKTLMKIIMPKSRPSDGMKLDVDLPQEDEFALSNYTTLSHYLFFFFPNKYKKFYLENIRFNNNRSLKWINDYHTIIQRIYEYTNKSKIIIKNPSNTARIKYLVKKYPNAKFIHIYRNPIFVYLSTYKFFYELFPSVNLQKIGENRLKELVIYNYREMYKDYFKQKKLIRKENLIEIPFEEFRSSSLKHVKKIYQKFNIEGYLNNEDSFKKYIDNQKSHKMNTYKIEKDLLKRIKNEFKQSLKEMNYSTTPNNLNIIS